MNPAVLEGWDVRNSDWQFGVGVQHSSVPRMAVDVSYNRRWWGNFFTTHNAALTAADLDEVTLTAPQNPQLPGGGGYPVTFLVRNARQAVGVSDPYYTDDQDFGDETHYWHGVDVYVQRAAARLAVRPGGHQHRPRRQRHVRVSKAARPVDGRTAVASRGIIDGSRRATSPSRG